MNPSKDYVLINKDSEAEQANRINKIKREAYRELDKMSIEDMRKCLRLYGMKSDTMSNELVEAKLTEQVETAPDKFMLKWVNNPNKEINFVIEEAMKQIHALHNTQSVALLSPAAASLDQFKSYAHRGDRFKELALA